MPTKLFTLALIAHHTDNGDGSSSVHLYNNKDELVAELEETAFGSTLEEIESGDDPYEHGTLSEPSIELELDEDTGVIRLTRSISLSSDG